MVVSLPGPGACIVDPATSSAGVGPWAVGYVSAPGLSGLGEWAGWHAAVEARAFQQRLPMLRIFSDDHTTGLAGLTALVAALRTRTHQRHGHIGVVIVPGLEHLSPARDGSEQVTDALLRLHFAVGIQTATTISPAGSETHALQVGPDGRYQSRPARDQTFQRALLGATGP